MSHRLFQFCQQLQQAVRLFWAQKSAPRLPPLPEPPRPALRPEADVYAAKVEKLSQQKAQGQEHFKAILAQRDAEMEETKARYQKAAEQKE